MRFDAVIVGAGAAGMLAALRAAEAGARIALLDSHHAEMSNLWASSGLFSAAGTRFQRDAGVNDDAARWAADIQRKTHGAVDPAILASVTARSADVAHFLADQVGIERPASLCRAAQAADRRAHDRLDQPSSQAGA